MPQQDFISNYYNLDINGLDCSIFKIFKEYFKNDNVKNAIHVTISNQTISQLMNVSLTFSKTLKQLIEVFEINFKYKPTSFSIKELNVATDNQKTIVLIIIK